MQITVTARTDADTGMMRQWFRDALYGFTEVASEIQVQEWNPFKHVRVLLIAVEVPSVLPIDDDSWFFGMMEDAMKDLTKAFYADGHFLDVQGIAYYDEKIEQEMIDRAALRNADAAKMTDEEWEASV